MVTSKVEEIEAEIRAINTVIDTLARMIKTRKAKLEYLEVLLQAERNGISYSQTTSKEEPND